MQKGTDSARNRSTGRVVKEKAEQTHSRHESDFIRYNQIRFTFDTFVEGRSNQLARAAAFQVSENVGGASIIRCYFMVVSV